MWLAVLSSPKAMDEGIQQFSEIDQSKPNSERAGQDYALPEGV
jgi:hypothetical protein